MANLAVYDTKVYDELLRKIEPTDPNHADVLNPLFERLLNNVSYVKDQLQQLRFIVTDFGADNTGATDATADVQAAIDAAAAAGGGIVYFPPGTYKIDGQLLVQADNVSLEGAGKDATILDGRTGHYAELILVGKGVEPGGGFDQDNKKALTVNAGTVEKTRTVKVRRREDGETRDIFQSDANMSVTGVTEVKALDGTVYTLDTDYTVGGFTASWSDRNKEMGVNNAIDWAPAGAEPVGNEIYEVTFTYIEPGVRTVTLENVTDLAAGDWVAIHSEKEMWAWGRDYYQKGEIAQIESVDSTAGTITFRYGLRDSYLAGTGYVTKIDVTENIKVSDLQILRDNSAGNEGNKGITMYFVLNPRVENVHLEKCSEAALRLNGCIHAVVRDSYIIESMPAAGPTGTNYGISVSGCHGALIEGNHIWGGRHAIATGNNTYLRGHVSGEPNTIAISRDVIVRNNYLATQVLSGSYALDAHASTDNCLYDGNVIVGGTDFSARNLIFTNNDVEFHHGQHGIYGTSGQQHSLLERVIIENNRIYGNSSGTGNLHGIMLYYHQVREIKLVSVKKNLIRSSNPDDNGIEIDADASHYGHIIGRIEVDGNIIDLETKTSTTGLTLDLENAVSIGVVAVRDNYTKRYIRIDATYAQLVDVSGNTVDADLAAKMSHEGIGVHSNHAYTLQHGLINVTGNSVRGIGLNGIRVSGGGSEVRVLDNLLDSNGQGGLGSSSYMRQLSVTNYTDRAVRINGNSFKNSLNNPDCYQCIDLTVSSGAAAGTIVHAEMIGNILYPEMGTDYLARESANGHTLITKTQRTVNRKNPTYLPFKADDVDVLSFKDVTNATNKREVMYGAAPVVDGSAGYQHAGDIMFNVNADLGQPIGWVAISSGDPAGWAPFGAAGLKKFEHIGQHDGDGASTTLTFGHSLGEVPEYYTAQAASADAGAAEIDYVDADATNVYVHFKNPLPAGTGNIKTSVYAYTHHFDY